jgi:copper chaperone CopZ
MSTLTREFSIGGMHCAGCVKSVTGAVSRVPGVKHVDVSLENETAKVEFDGTLTQPDAIVAAVEGAGFDAHLR